MQLRSKSPFDWHTVISDTYENLKIVMPSKQLALNKAKSVIDDDYEVNS